MSKTAAASVAITPNLAGFRKALATELGVVTKGVPAPVLVEPDLTGFRALLNTLVFEVAKTVSAPVRVVPDFTGFAAALATGVNAAAKTVTAPVSVVPVGRPSTSAAAESVAGGGVAQAGNAAIASNAAAVAADREAAALRTKGAELTKSSVAARNAAKADQLLATFSSQAAHAQEEILGAASSVDAAQTKLTRTKQALATAERAVAVAAVSEDEALLATAQASEVNAIAARNQAAADLEAARAAAARGASVASAGRAVVAQGASLTGLRGAALASGGAFIAAAAGTILFSKALKSVADFQVELATFGVTAGATAEQMAQVGEEARKLGADVTLPGVSAGDAAQAMLELAKAGLSVQDSIAGARGVLQLATAAGIDNAAATELAAAALNAFGLAGNEAVHVADVLANAANDAQGSISDIGLALSQAAAVGRQAGLTLEQTTAVLTLFARNGLRGSDAGTSFRTMLIRLINPTTKAQEIIKQLGLQLRTATGAINLQFFDQFTAATKNLTKAERDKDLAIITGQDAIRGAAILTREGSAAVDQEISSLNRAGTAADVAAARNVGLAGATANLKNQLENLGLTIGGIASGPLTVYLKGLGDLVQQTGAAIEATVSLGQKLADLASKIPGESALTGLLSKLAKPVAVAQISPAGAIAIGVSKAIGSLTELRGSAEETGSAVRKIFAEAAGRGDLGLNVAINQLDDLSKKLAGGDEKAQQLGKAVATLANQLRTAAQQGAVFPLASVKIPPELLAGTPGKTVALKTKAAFAAELAGPDIFSIVARGFHQMVPAINQEGDKAVAAVVSVGQKIKNAVGQQAGLEETANLLTASGAAPSAQVANLRRQQVVQQRIIDQAGPGAAGDALKARRAAAAKLAQINTQIKAIQDQVASDAQQAASDAEANANKIQAERDKADQAVLDSFTGGQNRINLAQISANATERLNDDIALQTLIITTAQREQKIIEDTVKDAKTRNAQIATRVQTIKAARVERDRLEQEVADAVTQRRQDAFQAQVDLAAAQGNIPAQIRFISVRIKAIDNLIAAGTKEGAALNRLKTERETLRAQREDIQNQQIQDQIALGQSIQDLTGNKNPLVQALNKAIVETRQDIAAAKKAGKSTTVLQTELNNFLAQRKDVLKGAADQADQADKGLSAFDLLKEFNAKFNDIAGNLITGDQPFAGGSAFSTDIVNKAVASIKAPARKPTLDAGIAKGADATDRNTQAITALTDAILKSTGNTAASDGKPGKGPGTINRWGAGAWWNASHFREVRDG